LGPKGSKNEVRENTRRREKKTPVEAPDQPAEKGITLNRWALKRAVGRGEEKLYWKRGS